MMMLLMMMATALVTLVVMMSMTRLVTFVIMMMMTTLQSTVIHCIWILDYTHHASEEYAMH